MTGRLSTGGKIGDNTLIRQSRMRCSTGRPVDREDAANGSSPAVRDADHISNQAGDSD